MTKFASAFSFPARTASASNPSPPTKPLSKSSNDRANLDCGDTSPQSKLARSFEDFDSGFVGGDGFEADAVRAGNENADANFVMAAVHVAHVHEGLHVGVG